MKGKHENNPLRNSKVVCGRSSPGNVYRQEVGSSEYGKKLSV